MFVVLKIHWDYDGCIFDGFLENKVYNTKGEALKVVFKAFEDLKELDINMIDFRLQQYSPENIYGILVSSEKRSEYYEYLICEMENE